MLKNKIKSIARVLSLIMVINIIPVSNTKVYADNIESSSLTLPSTEKSIYGPYNGTTDKKHAVEPFSEDNPLDDYEYNKDTVLIKMKNKKSLFGLNKNPSVKNSAIKSLEEIDLGITSSGISPYSEENVSNSGTWYKAKLVKDSDVATVLNELNEEDNVLVAEPEYIRRLETSSIPDGSNDEGMKDQWYLDTIGVKEAWKHLESQGINPGGSSDVVVAVIDTGVDYKHPDLAANIWTNTMEIPNNGVDDDGNGYVDDVYGACTISGQTEGDPMDDNGHGTHVAGIIASQANNDIGGVGIAYNTKIMPIKAAQSSGILTATDIARAVIYAAENGADVINMSYGGYGRSIIEEDALAMAYTNSVLVASAGNDGLANEKTPATPDGKPIYPGSYPWVLGVMASSQAPNKNGDWLTSFSNWDIKPENSLEYEVMAPGSKIYSTLPNEQYARWDGTSMSAPVVSGIAALVRSKYTDKESYSSRFIMGQLASTGVEKQGITYSNSKPALKYKEVSAINALTKTPKPKVTYMEHYIFDKDSNGSTENSDGVVDSGEIVDIGMVIRNHWGKAEDVTVTIDTKSSAGIDDPYVEIINGSVNYGAIGNFGSDDNGFIYEGDELIGVKNPFKIKVKENTPNNHVVKFNVTLTAKNGFDSNDTFLYTQEATISFVVRKGTLLPNVIDKDMTLTKDNYWIIPNATVIKENATVTVEPGTQIQFWSSEPESPYGEKPIVYLQVKGKFIAEGTEDEPIDMFPSSEYAGYEVNIYSTKTSKASNSINFGYDRDFIGNAKLKYVNISNPNIRVNNIDHCYFTQDFDNVLYKRELQGTQVQEYDSYGPLVSASSISNSKFYKLGILEYYKSSSFMLQTYGVLTNNIFDNCIYLFSDKVAENNVFLKNYKSSENVISSQGEEFGYLYDEETFKAQSVQSYTNLNRTYFIVDKIEGYYAEEDYFNAAQNYAKYLGGNIVTINDESEKELFRQYLSDNNQSEATIGLHDMDGSGTFRWISSENGINPNLDGDSTSYRHRFVRAYYYQDWETSSQVYKTAIELPYTITEEKLEQKRLEFLNSGKMSQINNNAILNVIHDANVDHWMRFYAEEGDENKTSLINNYWGTTSEKIISSTIVDYNDYKTLGEIKYSPYLTTAPESAYPFVTNVQVTDENGNKIDKVGAQKIYVNVYFNRDMNTKVNPNVTFGPDNPTTDYRVNGVDGGWKNSRTWVGEFNITPMTGDGYQLFKIIGAEAADDKWLVTGNDAERFRFEIITSGVESMNLQADGDGNKIKLTWNQDDFDTLAGYNVYRSESEDGDYVKINSTIIPSHIKSYTDTKVEPGKTYYYKFTVLQTDMTESDFSNIASAAAVDSILPTISHNPVTSGTIGMPLKLTANVTDNVKVDSVVLNYRQTGDSNYKTKEMTNIEGTRYSATIEGSYITSKGIEYYIEASDGVGKATSGTSQSPNKVVVADNPKITSLSPIEGPDTGGTKVTISGSNFKDGMKVKFNNVDATNVVVESPTRATLITPSNSAGVVDVKVVNPNGGSSTLYKGFKYIKEGVNLTVNNAQGKKGSYVEVPIDVNYIDGLTALDMEFNYDPSVLKFIGVRNGELTTDFAVSSYEEEQGKVNISMASADEANGTGSLVYVKLQVLEETDKKNSSLTLSNVELNGGAIKENITNGQFNILKGNSVYGNVNYYYNGIGMNNVNVLLRGEDTQHDALTNNYGSYNIKDVYNGNYTLSASKNDEVNGITSYDASLVLQASSKKISLSNYQTIAADVNSDGKVNAVDASLILAYSAGKISLPFSGTADIWKFETYNKNININEYDSYGNDLYGILVGDVSGNWGSSNDPSVQDSKADFNIGTVITNNDGTYTMPVTVEMSNANLFGTDLVISYDSEIATPIKVEKNEEVSTFGMEVNTSKPGEIRISLAGATSFDSSGDFINVVFETKNKNALVASTTVKDANVNENNVEAVVYNSKDVNKDKSVDILDLATMAVNYNSKKESSSWKDFLDINRDGIVDLFDLVQVSRNID